MLKILNKIKNLIKLAKIIDTVDTNRVTIQTLGKDQSAVLIMPYGIEIDPPENNVLCLTLSESGNENSMFCIPVDIEKLVKTKIIFRDNEKIIFAIDNKVGGDFMARFNELKSGFDQLKSDMNSFITGTYNIHTHVETGATTLIPNQLGTSSTASIDAAKITEIEVPEL